MVNQLAVARLACARNNLGFSSLSDRSEGLGVSGAGKAIKLFSSDLIARQHLDHYYAALEA